jgi:hypothetical protein
MTKASSIVSVWHEELSGMVQGPPLFDGQQAWVKLEDVGASPDLRSQLEHILNRGMVLQMSSAHGGGYKVVGLDMRGLPERHMNEDEAENVLTQLKVEAIMALLP